MKLIPGKMNVVVKICKTGYAEGVLRPKREKKVVPFNTVTIVRKAA
jgi:hypothetical protein